MKYFSETEAFALVRQAIEFGAVKLQGPANTSLDGAAKCAERDAMYLLTLLNKLQAQ